MQRAFVAGVIIAILAAISGFFIVLRRYSLIGETLSHASLVGVAIGVVSGVAPLWMALFIALFVALLIELLKERFEIYSDSILAIMLSGSLALALIIVSLGKSFNTSLFAYLFGSILSVTNKDIFFIISVGSILLVFLLYFAAKFYYIAYDEEVAKVSGLDVAKLNFLQMSITAVIVALSIKVVGSLLIGALMVIPVNAALLYRKGFIATLLLSLVFAVVSVIGGIILSYYFDLPSGATIVLFVILIFIFSLVQKR